MASKKTTTHHTKARAKDVTSSGVAVRNRVRELSVGAFRDRKLSLNDLPKLVHEILEGAVEGVDKSIPESSHNVLREVFDGLSEGVEAIVSAGSAAVTEVRERGRTIAGKNASDAAGRIRTANDEFLGAVTSFAGKASKQVREELHSLVARAERTRPKVADSARKAAKAADGRLMELSEETARAGVRIVRRAAGALAMGVGGFLEGLAETITPKGQPTSAKTSRTAPKRAATKKATKKTTKKKTTKKLTHKASTKKTPSKSRKA